MITVICSYCRKLLGFKKSSRFQFDVSHGICKVCLARERAKIKEGAQS